MPDLSGFQRGAVGDSPFNVTEFIVRNMLARVCTATLVRVKSVTNAGAIDDVGFVDIEPLVNLLDAKGNAIEHGVIFHCPYLRIQGGTNAVIMDPVAGDIGIAVFADRDITSVISNKDRSNPGSFRQHSMADGLYLGGVLNGAPTQWVQFSTAGIKIHSPTKVTLEAPDVTIEADAAVEINAGTSIDLNAATVAIDASGGATVTAPTFTINGATLFNGPISQVPGTQSGGGTATLDGPLAVTNDVTAAGKSVSTHRHLEHDGYSTATPT